MVRLGEYLQHIREVERRIQRAEQQSDTSLEVPAAPVGVPEAYEDHVGVIFDLLALAYEADLTRVFTFMLARELSQRTYPNIGVTLPHHVISHHARALGSDQRIVMALLWSVNQTGGLTSMSRNVIPRSRAPGAYSARYRSTNSCPRPG